MAHAPGRDPFGMVKKSNLFIAGKYMVIWLLYGYMVIWLMMVNNLVGGFNLPL